MPVSTRISAAGSNGGGTKNEPPYGSGSTRQRAVWKKNMRVAKAQFRALAKEMRKLESAMMKLEK